MAKIPLRVYNREIENLIDRGQIDEALAHCKHVLQTFPKYIEAYRLLGKSYLESQRYAEASDILQRVLSSVPDDFVSHVGLSIVREDEGKLDTAIWHMERAYEIQPSNAAVQDELRRLYGQRDGAEPTRIRLTRSGLARMHARGDLQDQAISELVSILAEDKQRPDLQVLLASLYFQTGKRVEAAEICSALIASYPYCLEANRILAEILPGTSRADEAAAFRQRVIALDPYLEFITPEAPESTDVADTQILIDRLEWDPNRILPPQPATSTQLGLSLEGKETRLHVLPDWLASLSPIPAQNSSPASSPPFNAVEESEAEPVESPVTSPLEGLEDFPIPAELLAMDAADESGDQSTVDEGMPALPLEPFNPAGQEDIPDWMKDAGWEISNEPVAENPVLFAFEAEENAEPVGEAIPAEVIPEWLQSLAPVEPIEQPEDENLPMLEEILAANTNEPAAGESIEAPEALVPLEELFPEPVQAEEEISSPLEASQPIEPIQVPEPLEPLPAWMVDLKQVPSETESDEPALDAFSSEPVWPVESPILPLDSETPTIPMIEDQQATLAWLEDIAAKHGSDAETIISKPADRIANPPSWVRDQNQGLFSTEPEPEIPDWLRGLEVPASSENQEGSTPAAFVPSAGWFETSHTEESEQQPLSSEPVEAIQPDWIPEPQMQAIQPASQAALDQVSLPIWILSLSEEPVPTQEQIYADLYAHQEIEGQEEEVAEIPISRGSEPSESTVETAGVEPAISMDWLQELQASSEQAAIPSETPGSESTSEEALERWLAGITGEIPETEAPVPGDISEAVSAAWVTETPEQTIETTPEMEISSVVQPEAIPELPDWMSSLEPTTEEAPAVAQESLSEVVLQPEEGLGWFDQVEAVLPQAVPEITESAAVEATPEELEAPLEAPAASVSEEQPVSAVGEISATQPVEEDNTTLPDWLADLESFIPADTPVEPHTILPEALAEPVSADLPTEEEFPVEEVRIEEVPAEEIQLPVESEAVNEPLEPAESALVEPIAEVKPSLDHAEEFVPDWLTTLKTEEEAPSGIELPSIPVGEEAVEPVGPDWLAALQEPVVPVNEVEESAFPGQSTNEQIPAESTSIYEDIVAQPEIPEAVPVQPVRPVQPDQMFAAAQAALNTGQIETAVDGYSKLIVSGKMLEESVHDLRNAISHYPIETSIWQALGDAYLRMNQVQDALDAYTKAEELMR